ncbi:MAG: hypothetical protein ACKO0M_02405 [Cyanobium sp.]
MPALPLTLALAQTLSLAPALSLAPLPSLRLTGGSGPAAPSGAQLVGRPVAQTLSLAQTAATPLAPRPLSSLPADLQGLAGALERHGFRVRLTLPPQRRSYGLFESRSRTLWISPLSFELGIGRQTFLHEATHAVQSCPHGVLRPIGWSLSLEPAVERGIRALLHTGYHSGSWVLEREAFALQGQPDAVARLLAALEQRCRSAWR